jgi:alpha-L-fucosidase 2
MKKILFPFVFALAISAHAQDVAPLKLWYNAPSGKTWENALPIGNGRARCDDLWKSTAGNYSVE